MSPRLAVAAVIAALLIASAAPAHAAVISLGPGRVPGVAVDAMGTAYIAWVGIENDPTTLQFCRLPRGATACDIRHAITATGTSISRPFVTVDGSAVRVLSYRYALPGGGPFDGDMLYTSTDGGASFGEGVRVGSTPFNDAVLGPGGGISLVTDAVTGGEYYQRVPIDGSPATESRALLSETHPYSGSVALVDSNTPLAVYANGSGAAQFRRYSGMGDLNDAASWNPPVDIGYGDRMHLASGPSGLFLKSATAEATLQVRRFDGTTFGPGVVLPNGTGELAQSHMVQDAAGRLHVLWPRNDGDALRLYYATSDDGTNWQQGTLDTDAGITQVRTAIANDHVGIAVWATSGTANSEIHVRGGVGPTPPVAPPPTTQPPTSTPPTQPPSTPTVPPRQTIARVPGATITFITPGSCVPPGGTFRARLKWKKQRRKGNLFIKIKRTDFYVNTRRVKKDTRPPFVHTFRVAVGTQPGTTITLRARAFIKSHDRKRRTKSIRARVRVCG
jgi:hypothetical protein